MLVSIMKYLLQIINFLEAQKFVVLQKIGSERKIGAMQQSKKFFFKTLKEKFSEANVKNSKILIMQQFLKFPIAKNV